MTASPQARDGDFPFDVALSFASEQRTYVDKVAKALRRRGLQPFYDKYEQASMWGKDLYEHLDDVYRKKARYCIIFVSKAYAAKAWTAHERRSAQARALEANNEYILPVRFDDTELPGLRPTVHYIDAGATMPAKLAQIIAEKLGPKLRSNYLPDVPDKLYLELEIASDDEKNACNDVARSFMETMGRMSPEEAQVISHIFRERCPSALLDERPHMHLDILRRDLKTTPDQVLQLLDGVASLGFTYELDDNMDGHTGQSVISLEWDDRRMYDKVVTM